MNTPKIRQATKADRADVVATVTLAFSVDSLNRWLLPGSSTFVTYFPQIADAFVAASIDAGGCFVTSGLGEYSNMDSARSSTR